MQIAALLGSPRKKGNSATLAMAFVDQAAGLGAQTQVFSLNQLKYKGCQGCYACKGKSETCALNDDLSPVLQALAQADIWVVASPIYFGQISGQLKCCLDRWFSFLKPDFVTNPTPSRLPAGKQSVWVLTQGESEEAFAEVSPGYTFFLKWYGFKDNYLLRASTGNGGGLDVPPAKLAEAQELARKLVA